MKSALEANDLLQDLVVSRSKLGKVFCAEGPPDTLVQQGLNHLGFQHSDFKAKGDGCPFIQLWAALFEACAHETHPSVDFE